MVVFKGLLQIPSDFKDSYHCTVVCKDYYHCMVVFKDCFTLLRDF